MRTMRMLIILAGISTAAIPAAQAAEGMAPTDQSAPLTGTSVKISPAVHAAHNRRLLANRFRPHDSARPVVRVAHGEGHEAGSAGVIRPKVEGARPVSTQRFAGLDRVGGACDSILCPGYAMLGVGF